MTEGGVLMQWNSGFCARVALAVLIAVSAQAQGIAFVPVISVGPNVEVSKQFPKLLHQESWAAGDPDHAGRLLACSQVEHFDHAVRSQHCYASFDDGKSWSAVLELDREPMNADPAITYGRGDTAFIVVLTAPRYEDAGYKEGKRFTNVYRSVDGGKTWAHTTTFPFIDRESIVVDETNGKYAGRVYINGVDNVSGFEAGGATPSIHLYRSTDGGTTFAGPIQRGTLEGGSILGSTSSVLLSDGTLAFMTAHVKKGRSQNLDEGQLDRSANVQLQVLTSTDGGESMNPAVTVSEWYMDRNTSEGGLIGHLGADPGSRYFKDRLYAVWPDVGSGRYEIRFSYSSDKGKTWSPSIRVNDDRPPLEQTRGPDQIVPVVGVNKAGVVLVVWYDRRESGDNMGWKIRAAASLDGGLTFTPSTPVSDAASVFNAQTEWIQDSPRISGGGDPRPNSAKGRPIGVDLKITSFFLGGHTSGMAVGTDGVFHPAWIDNRTGVGQIWTAPITVRGSVEKHGASDLAELDDVTDNVILETQSTNYDRATNTLTLTARLRNTSKVTVRAPLKARVIALTSELGVAAIAGAANGVTTVGAIWDFGSMVPAAGLPPDSTTATRTLTFRLTDVRPIRLVKRNPGFTAGLVHFEVRVYGKGGNGEKSAP